MSGFSPALLPALATFSGSKPGSIAELLSDKRIQFVGETGSGAVANRPEKPLVVGPKSIGTMIKSTPRQVSFEERIFDSLVSLKVAVSQYAMHLSSTERRRIFERLDSVINSDDWHEEDLLPHLPSFQNFLKWMIYSRCFAWSSIGISNEGNILIAWSRPKLALTANFSTNGKVTWTASVETDEGEAHSVGTCSLQYFTKQVQFYLGSEAPA